MLEHFDMASNIYHNVYQQYGDQYVSKLKRAGYTHGSRTQRNPTQHDSGKRHPVMMKAAQKDKTSRECKE